MCAGIVAGVLEGVNGTVFAYGQTSSGKTHTMLGSDEEPGVVPLATRQLFEHITGAGAGREYLLRVSYLEIYNERVRDLLSCDERALAVREDPKRGGCYVAELTEEVVTGPEQVAARLAEGEKRRAVARTAMNDHSSRSHTIVRVVVESRDSQTGTVRMGTLNLVDLAGSERLAHSKAEGERAKEGAAINRSLLTLGTVIRKLSSATPSSHVPYRDAVLTRLLQVWLCWGKCVCWCRNLTHVPKGSLGGNCRAAVVCTISPALQWVEESLSTLKFASHAKMVTNRVEINEVHDEDAALLQRYRTTIAELTREVERLRADAPAEGLAVQLAQREDEVQRLRALIVTARSATHPDTRHVARRETWCAGLDGTWSFVGGSAGAAAAAAAAVGKDEEEADAHDNEHVQALEADNRALDARVRQLELAAEATEAARAHAAAQASALHEALAAADEQLSGLRREHTLAQAQLAQAAAARREWDCERQQHAAERERARALEARAARADELELEVSALQWERTKAEEEAAQLRQVAAARGNIEALSDKARTRVETLEREISELEEEVEREAAQSERQRKELERVRAELAVARDVSQRDAATLREALAASEARAEASARELAGALKAVESLRSVMRAKEEKMALEVETAHKRALDAARVEKSKADADHKRALADKAKALELARAESAKAQAAADEARAALARLQAEAVEMNAAHEAALLHKDKKLVQLKELAMEKAKEKIRERDAVIARLKKERARIDAERDQEAEETAQRHQAELELIRGQLAEARGELKVAPSKKGNLRSLQNVQ